MNKLYALFFACLFSILFADINLFAQTSLQVTVLEQTAACNNDATVTLGIIGGTAPFTSHWIRYGIAELPDTAIVTTDNPVTGVEPGYYNVHVYDAIGLFGQIGVYVQPPFFINPQLSPATCTLNDGKIVVIVNNDVPPFTYEWSTGAINTSSSNRDSIENIPAGSYELTVTNGNGCVANLNQAGTSNPNQGGLNLWSTSPITATNTSTPSNCFDGTATVIPANGTEPYQYLWNTTPAQTSQTAVGLAPGFYSCLITDAEGCTRNAFVNVNAGPNFLQVNANQVNTTCNQATGSISATVSGGQAPFTYLWSNGATTSSISGLAYGNYSLTVTDNAGCSITVHKFINNANPMHLTFSGVSPTCNQSDGAVSLNIAGGTAPYDILWSNGASNVNTISGLAVGSISVQISDANGCVKNGFYHLPISSACLANISGRVHADHNEDCTIQGTEPGIAGVVVRAGSNYAYSQANGNYGIMVNPGTYDVQQFPPAVFTQICPENNESIQVNAANEATTYGGNNFYNGSETIFNDVAVYLYSSPIRPGFQATYYITVKNIGVTAATASLTFTHDDLLAYISSTPNLNNYSAATRTATWNAGPLSPNQTKHYQIRFLVSLDALAQLGEEIDATAQVNLVAAVDANPDNNTVVYSRAITGSYDPNDKAVSPKGITEQGFIFESDTLLSYLIRFQNTGNDTAFTVVVRDTLDPALDVSTFKLGGYSHPMQLEISGTGILTFTFNNILLPDSNINEPASHGYIAYDIALKKDLPLGTQIQNTAYIYFDFNPPIITNTTLNTIFDATVGIASLSTFEFNIYPNPNDGTFSVKLEIPNKSNTQLELMDISGRVIHRQQLGVLIGENIINLDLGSLISSGAYFIRINAGDSRLVKKIIVR